MEEIWKPIKGYEGLYEVSNMGRVKRLPYTCIGYTKGHKRLYLRTFQGGILKGTICKNGYYRVTLTKNGVNKYYHVHRLVAEAFIENPNNLPFINHRDETRTNNWVDNLEWCTCQYNNTYGNARKRSAASYSRNRSYPVKMYSVYGEFIKTFPSVKDAAKEVGVTHNSLLRAISKVRKTAAGYVWERV